MMIHQDGSTHEWVPGQKWDLISTMDDATNEHYSMFFCDEEGTDSSFQGVKETIEKHGLFCCFYSDRGSHYWHTPEAGGKVDKSNPTQFGRAMAHLGISMIAAYSPEARGRSERAFDTHQGRLPNELALLGNLSSGDQQNETSTRNLNNDTKAAYRPLFIGRDTIRTPNIYQFDARYTRSFMVICECIKPKFIVEVNNLFNRENITALNTAVAVDANGLAQPGSSFLQPSSTVLEKRIVQFGIRVDW